MLLRSANDLDIYEEALRRQGLSTVASVGAYWERLEVGDLLAYLRALANPLDELALYGTLACPLVGVSGDGLALIAERSSATGRGVWDTLAELAEAPIDRLAEEDRTAAELFATRFARERRMASRRTIAELIERAVEQWGYREQLLALEWGERRLANVHKLIRLARRFESGEGRDLRGFLDHVAYRQGSRASSEPDAPVAGAPLDAVQLMTIHAAKGLEFPVVCVADLGRAQNLTMPELLVDGGRIGLRLIDLDGKDPQSTLSFDELWAERKREKAEEEERIVYVAMTRARERLLLSGAVAFQSWPQGERAPAIAWLGPALCEKLPKILAEAEHGVLDLTIGRDARTVLRLRVNTAEATRERAGEASGGGGSERPPVEPDSSPAHGVGETPASMPAGEHAQLELDLAGARTPASAHAGEPDLGPLSYTALSELERCGYRYYLERVLGLGEDRFPGRGRLDGGNSHDDMRASARGTLVHRLLEEIDFRGADPPGPQDVARVAAELGMRVEGRDREEIAELLSAVSSAAREGIEPAERVLAAASVHREHPFAFTLGADQPLLTGVIDLLARERDGSVLLLDYKTDSRGRGGGSRGSCRAGLRAAAAALRAGRPARRGAER